MLEVDPLCDVFTIPPLTRGLMGTREAESSSGRERLRRKKPGLGSAAMEFAFAPVTRPPAALLGVQTVSSSLNCVSSPLPESSLLS